MGLDEPSGTAASTGARLCAAGDPSPEMTRRAFAKRKPGFTSRIFENAQMAERNVGDAFPGARRRTRVPRGGRARPPTRANAFEANYLILPEPGRARADGD